MWFSSIILLVSSPYKTLLNTKRIIFFRGSFVQSQRKAFETGGEKFQNLENASFYPIHISLTICKMFLKRISQRFAKTKLVVQAWSKMLNKKEKLILAYLMK
jgi:hypothetical protein